VSRIDARFILALVVLAAILPLITSAIAGTLEIPRNDDWSYRRIATTLASTGRLELDGAAETMLLGQIAITQPLLWLSGGDPWAFAVAGLLFAVGGIVGAYALARQVLPPRQAVLAAALLPLFPGYLAYATSYMNDVPAMAFQFFAVALGAAALSRRPVAFGWLVAAALVGCLAFSMRHFALAAPAAILLAAVCAEPRRRRTWGLVALTAGSCLGIQLFRSSLPGQIGHINLNLEAWRLPSAIVTVSFVLFPAAIVAMAKTGRVWRFRHVLMGAVFGLGLVAISVAFWWKWGIYPDALMRNLVSQWGVPDPAYVTGGRPLLFSDLAWTAINLVGLITVVVVPACIAGVVGLHLRAGASSVSGRLQAAGSAGGTVLFFVALAGVGLILYGTVYLVFDRYLWPIVPPLAVLLLAEPNSGFPTREPRHGTWRTGATVVAFCTLLAFVALPLMANSHAFDAARWTAGERLVSAGVPADRIDAGYEWIGFHTTEAPTPANPVPAPIWYRGWWRDFQLCGLATSRDVSPAGGVLLGKVPYRLALVTGPVAELWVYEIDSPACQKQASAADQRPPRAPS
jgi:hypothetical protein